MPDTLTQCIEREREAEDYATPPHPGNEHCDTCAAVRTARAATDEAVRKVVGLERVAGEVLDEMAKWHAARHSPNHPPYLDCTGCWVWPWITQLRDALGREDPKAFSERKRATPAPTAQGGTPGGASDGAL